MADEPTEEEPEGKKPKKSAKLNLRGLNPYKPLVENSPLGALEARSLNLRGFRELAKQDGEKPFTPESFLPALLQQVARPVGREGGPLSTDEASLLAEARAEFLPRLIEIVGFHTEPVWESSDNEKGERVVRQVGEKLVLERSAGETDEEYLLRGWRDNADRTQKSFADTFNSLNFNLTSMDPLFRKSMVSQLAENLSASQSLAERLADMRSPLERLGKSSVADILGIDREPARLVQPPIIESPMKLTNDLLNDVRADIADMRELAVETAEMQRSLNDVARSILTEFTVGAADSRAAAEKTLKIAKFGLWIAGVSALLAAAAIFVSLWTGGPDPQELQVNRKQLEATQQQVQLLREERQAAERQIQLLRENRTALGELATRLPEPKSRTRKGQTRD